MEKFATDLDKLLDEFENEDISSNNIYECSDSSGYNSLKTSTELYPADLPIECTSSQFSEMNDIAELPTPTCDETDFTMSLTNAFQSPVVSESDIIQNESSVGVENIIESSIISSTDKTEISVSVTSPTNDISIIDPNINMSEPTVSPVSHVPPKKKLRPSSLFNVTEITRSEQPSSNEGSADNQLQFNSNSNSINSFESPETTSSTKKSIKRPLSLNLMSPGHNSVNNIPNIRINDDNQITTMSSSLCSEPSAAVDISQLKNDEEVLKVTETNDANVWQGIPLEELGQREPEWIKDDLKNNCMQCQLPFTMFRRRHHCRACGRLLCGKCCCWRMQLQFSNRFFPKDRVCAVCFQYLIRIEVAKKHKPNSTISNMNPNNSVLKSLSRPLSLAISPVSNSDNLSFSDSLNNSSQSKSVTFSDGIRPGGDLSEIEKSRIITPTKYQSQSKSVAYDSLHTSNSREPSFINQEDFVSSLPPLVIEHRNELIINLNSENVAQQTKTIESNPIILAITKNLHIHMEIIQLTSYACTHNQVCGDNIEEEGQCNCNEFWYFASVGLETIGCEEVVIVLKRLPKENCPPIEIFHYYFQIYQRAHKNETKYDCLEMTVELFPKTNVRLKDWAGIFHIRPTFQCLDKLPLPRSSFLIGILIHRWELPWAKILPLRLILALGNQSRYYPCSIVSDRNRPTVYEEISQTILQIINPVFSFAKNFEEGFLEPNLLPTIPGMWIHLLASQETIIQIPKLSYHSVLNILSYRQSECSTLALVACFSREADSHLVCCQNEDTCKYYSGAISILNTERTVTGATMIIFVPCDNSVEYGATIVEDVLVVRLSLIQLSCVVNSLKTLSNLILQWDSSLAQTNKKLESSSQNNNSIVSRSFIKIVWTDNHQFSEMAFIERPSLVTDETLQSAFLNATCEESVTLKSYRVPSSIQILSPEQNTFNLNLKIVWTRFHYYFLDKIFKESLNEEPLDVDDMIRRIAVCFSQAIDKYLDLLREMGLVNIGLRITLEKNNASFLVGCSKKNIYSTITPDQSPSDEPDSNQSSYAYFRMGYPRKFQTLSICTLPDICIESLNDTLVPFLYSLTEQILDNSITSELEFHIID